MENDMACSGAEEQRSRELQQLEALRRKYEGGHNA